MLQKVDLICCHKIRGKKIKKFTICNIYPMEDDNEKVETIINISIQGYTLKIFS